MWMGGTENVFQGRLSGIYPPETARSQYTSSLFGLGHPYKTAMSLTETSLVIELNIITLLVDSKGIQTFYLLGQPVSITEEGMSVEMTSEEVLIMIRACQLLREKGLVPNTDISEICQDAGISRESVYQWAEKHA